MELMWYVEKYIKIYIIFTDYKCINFLQNDDIYCSQTKNRDKYESGLNPENVPVEPYMYELYAIIIHSGNALEGHYYAFIKDFKTDQWLCFDDQSVSVVCINIK